VRPKRLAGALASAPGAGAGSAVEGANRDKRVRKKRTKVVTMVDALGFMIILK